MVALTKLESIPDGETFKDFVVRCFNDCRDKMVLRAQQAWSFWGALPYSLLELSFKGPLALFKGMLFSFARSEAIWLRTSNKMH
jgi:hypothetical protein